MFDEQNESLWPGQNFQKSEQQLLTEHLRKYYEQLNILNFERCTSVSIVYNSIQFQQYEQKRLLLQKSASIQANTDLPNCGLITCPVPHLPLDKINSYAGSSEIAASSSLDGPRGICGVFRCDRHSARRRINFVEN